MKKKEAAMNWRTRAIACAIGVLTNAVIAAQNLNDASWIGDGRPAPANEAAYYDVRPAPEFRARFVCPKGMEKTVLRIAAAGYYRLSVNGVPPDEPADLSLTSLWSPYGKTVYSDEYPLAALRPWPETNEVSVVMGNGFYNLPPLRFWGSKLFRRHLASGEPVFKLAVDGARLSEWEWRETKILRNCVYLGSEIDATRDAGKWRPAVKSRGPSGRIVPRKAPKVGTYGRLKGKSRWLKEGEVQVVDFRSNNSGVPVFRIRARRGTRIEFLYGERLHADGSVNVLTQAAGQIKKGRCSGGPGAPATAAQRDVYICSGDVNGEEFSPPFTWHICRYVEVRGLDRLLGDGEAELKLVSSLVADAPKLVNHGFTGDRDLDRIHEVCRRTFRANLVGVQSDCPGRERLGYGGDIVAVCEAYCLNFDMREFYLKTLQDFADEASGDGWITETAPYVGIGDRGFGGRAGPLSWALAVPVLMDSLLRHYGETRALEYYPVCARYVRLVAAKTPGGITARCLGDHEALQRPPAELTATAHWHEFVRLTAEFAGRLGKTEDETEFRALAKKIREAFAAKFVKDDGTVGDGSQSAQATACHLGLVPERLREKAFAKLVAAVEAKGGAPTTGIFSTRYMLLALSENGRVDLARKIVLHRGFPGWMHMLDRGATTLWETWKESDNTFSNCHPMFGSVDEWILRFAQTSTSPTGVNSGMKMVWSDEFDYDDSKLEEKWVAENASPGHIICSRWRENAVVTNGMLRLCNRKERRGGKEWTSASVWTKARFKYGYFECRYRYAAAKGTNNSFWFTTIPHKAGEDFEMDVNEGHYPSKINTNIHDFGKVVVKDGKKRHKVYPKAFDLGSSVDLAKEFHVYGFLWTADELVFYFDGKEIRRVKNEVCHSACPIFLSEAILKWAGPVTDAIDGTFMEVDYVRVYEVPVGRGDKKASK
jgi:alpha-L-rhamnosidase